MTSPSVVNWAANPAIGSGVQAASLTAALDNLNAKDKPPELSWEIERP